MGTVSQFFTNTYNAVVDSYHKLFDEKPIASKLAQTAGYWEDYFSGSDVGVFIGDTWVDDIVTIQYCLTNNKSPVYGYMSENFDAVAKGTRIVQGQFVIAFHEVGYLSRILDDYQTKNKSGTSQKNALGTYTKQVTTGMFTPVDKFGYIDSAHGSYIARDGFDIFVTFGDVSGSVRGGTAEIINNCHITSRSLVCEPSGEPIAEVYSFFARGLNEYTPKYDYLSSGADSFRLNDPEAQAAIASELGVQNASKLNLDWRQKDTQITWDEIPDDELKYLADDIDTFNIRDTAES